MVSLIKKKTMQYIEPKLTIELVPKTSFFNNVRHAVSTQEWDKLKKMTYKKANYKCEICGGRGYKHPVEAHEIWHYDDKNHIQTLRGLIALCPTCHLTKHLGFAQLKGREKDVFRQLMKVNNWNEAETQQYVEAIWEIWYFRSQFKWTLNLDYLTQIEVPYSIDLEKIKAMQDGV
jgi:uncharacterized membrane protein (GlpM family)